MTTTVTSRKLDQVIAPYYCKLALLLCQQARELLYENTTCDQASGLCRLISTLCIRNDCDDCREESHICETVSEKCLQSESLGEARELCDRARRACPKGFSVHAS